MNTHAALRVSLLSLVLGVPPPALSAGIEAPWDDSPAPFVFMGDPLWVDSDRVIDRPVEVQQHAGINVDGGRSLRIEGPVSNHGLAIAGLYKLGAGHMAISGANTYRGSSALLQGSLALEHSQALGWDYNTLDANTGTRLEYADGIAVAHGLRAQSIDLTAMVPFDWWAPIAPTQDPGALQWAVERGMAEHRGNLFGTAAIVKLGQGTLRFSGMGMSYDGEMTVREGVLRVDGILGGLTRVEPGAQLQGAGSLGAAWIGGTVAPAGDEIGMLFVQGNLDFASGAQTRVQIRADGSGDRLGVGGTAQLAGHVAVDALPGAWRRDTQYTILQAGLGLAGSRFDSVAGNLPFLSPELSYAPDRVFLTMLRNDTGLDACGGTVDARDAGRVIDHDVQALEDRIEGQSCAEAGRTLASLAHVGAASLRSALIEDTRYIRQAALTHAGSGRVWTQSWASNATRAARWNGRDARWAERWADSRDTSGLLVGIDRAIAPGWHLGGFAGAQHMDFATQSGVLGTGGFRARSLSVHAGATLATGGEDWFLALGAAHGRHHSRSLRDIGRQIGFDEERLRATQPAGSTQVWVEWRAEQPLAQRWALQPWAQLAWVRLDSQSYTEEGGLAALQVRGAVDQRVFSTLGIQATRALSAPHGLARVRARLGWQAMMGATDLVSTQSFRAGRSGQTFLAGGQPLARHALQLELGVDAPVVPGVRLGLGYTGQVQSGGPQHGVVLNLGIGW